MRAMKPRERWPFYPGEFRAVSTQSPWHCECPVRDNHHGAGRYGDGERHGWIINPNCHVHTEPKKEHADA